MTNKINNVSITIGSTMYGRFEDLPNTVSHDLAEFVDNALQSYRDNKPALQGADPDYKLQIFIDIIWDLESKDKRAKRITIRDNAAGINTDKYIAAFMPAKTPDNNKGLNEFGMGLKTAACWLGRTWSVKTKAINENIERSIDFELSDVIDNELKELPVVETPMPLSEHFTEVSIINMTKNAPAQRSLEKIRKELSSIYRQSLRNKEMDLFVCGKQLDFEEHEILVAPFVRNPGSTPIYWKKEISFDFGKYHAKGFIGILKNMNKDHNRIVLLRRGRVIIGAESEGHYYSKHISGQSGSPRDKRIFGELELSGFDVTFNKNDVQDKENLEAMFEALQSEIHNKDFDLVTQAQEYRQDDNHKIFKKITKDHNKSSKDSTPVQISTAAISNQVNESDDSFHGSEEENDASTVIDGYEDFFCIDNTKYTCKVEFVDGYSETKDLFWVDVSEIKNNILTCRINTRHIFFENFGKCTNSIIALLKSFAISKFISKEKGNDTGADIFNYFNEYIKKIKV